MCCTERPDIELLCSVLVVADQLLVVRLKEMCEEALTALCEFHRLFFELITGHL